MPYTETVHSSREIQRKIDAENHANTPVKMVVYKSGCFKREIFIFVDNAKEAELSYDENDWERAFTVARALHRTYKKGLEKGKKIGEEEEYKNAKGFHTAYYRKP